MSTAMNSRRSALAGKGAAIVLACIAALCLCVLSACSGASSSSSAASSSTESASSSAAETSTSSAASESESSAAASESSSEAEGSESSAASEATEEGPTQEEIEAAIDAGKQVFPGTLRVMTMEELVGYTDLDPALFHEGDYAVLFFDAPVQVSGMSADGSGMRRESASMLGVAEYTDYGSFVIDTGDVDSWRPYDGKHVTLAVAAEDIMFPSDVRLPLGQPSTGAAVVL